MCVLHTICNRAVSIDSFLPPVERAQIPHLLALLLAQVCNEQQPHYLRAVIPGFHVISLLLSVLLFYSSRSLVQGDRYGFSTRHLDTIIGSAVSPSLSPSLFSPLSNSLSLLFFYKCSIELGPSCVPLLVLFLFNIALSSLPRIHLLLSFLSSGGDGDLHLSALACLAALARWHPNVFGPGLCRL